MIDGLLQDLRVGWRSLARTPAFTFVVVLVLGLGIGVNTLIFSILNGFMFRALPYIDSEKTVLFTGVDARRHASELSFSNPDVADLAARTTAFERIGQFFEWSAYTTVGREPERFDAAAISPGFLAVLGTRPMLGREFLPEEAELTRSRTVTMVSERVWRERLGADPRAIGRTLKMNGRMRTIVGVAPVNFRFPENSDWFVPVGVDPADGRDVRYLSVLGRLKPGVRIAKANAEVKTIFADLARNHPDSNKDFSARVMPFREKFLEEMRPILALLMSAVAFVLLIACANVANLMLARGAGLQREIALRFALGATRARVVRQRLVESLLLALGGGVLGLLLAVWGRDLILNAIPEELPYWMDFSTDLNMLMFTLAVALAAAVIAGLVPALQTSQVDVNESLKEGGHHGTGGRGRSRLRSTLVVAEIALALVLLAGAGLMIRSFTQMTRDTAEVRAGGVLTAQFTMPIATYEDADAKRAFVDGLMPAVEGLPRVVSASAISMIPLGHSSWSRSVLQPGQKEDPEHPAPVVTFATIRPRYFETMGIALREGREFTAQDGARAGQVAIVSEAAAKTLWPGKDAIGRQFHWGDNDTTGVRTVVGVVADVRQRAEERRPMGQVYVPHAQEPVQGLTLVVRHEGDPGAMAAALRTLVASRDADMPLYRVQTMNESIRQGFWEPRLYATMMAVFAVLALVIAAVGIYGVMAYSVAQRTQEIGIRMALGATRQDVVGLVVGQAFRLTMLGVGIGLAGAYAVTRLMASLLFGVSAGDPPTFIGVTVILALSAVLAAWAPAERAARVDPMVALRSE